jgi:hypothetical protein
MNVIERHLWLWKSYGFWKENRSILNAFYATIVVTSGIIDFSTVLL